MNTSSIKILITDDELDALDFIGYNLRKEGYQVFTADNGTKSIEIAKREQPHLIILDVMMPELDGIQTCKTIRELPEFKDTLIIFLTARNEEFTQLVGLEAGADDYITKPIKPRLLVSKIKSLLRRYQEDKKQTAIKVADLEINQERFSVQKGEELLELPKKEFYLLYLLASKPGKVFTREKILRKVWGPDVIVNDRTIDVHIRKLREKLGKGYIKTIKGIGYKFNR